MNKLPRRKFVQLGLTSATGLLLTGMAGSAFAAGTDDGDVLITDTGARGDGTTLNTSAIQKAIDKCAKKGGGRVVVPAGTFLSGSLYLKSKVTLHLEKDAILLSTPFFKDFPQRRPLKPVRYQKYLNRALVYAQGEKDIAITGSGIMDGNARLDGSGEFKEQKAENPSFIWFDECENVLVKDITFRRSVWWTQAYTACKNVHIDHITVKENYFYNADGCDIVDCEDFLVENCDIDANDDGICLKGYTAKGCQRGLIRNNKVRTLCNGIKMGTDSSGGFKNITIENNEVWETGISGLALQIVDGGIMENIIARNLTMNGVGSAITLRLGNRNRIVYGDLTVQPGILHNVHISDIKARQSKAKKFNEEEKKRHNLEMFSSSICGVPGCYISDVTIENVSITIPEGFPPVDAEASLREIPEVGNKYPENRMFGLLPAYGFYIRHAKGIRMKNVSVEVQQKDGRPAFILDDVHDSVFDGITVKNPIVTPAVSVQQNCSGITLNQ